MPLLPFHLLQARTSPPPSSLKPRSDPTFFEVRSADDSPTQEQIKAFDKWFDGLPEDSKKKLKKIQKEHGLTRNQLILAGLKQWAPGYVGTFKMAMFFGIV
ncbi:hypothetical protein EAE96_004761 [Botrytis aclada]|nr:hypothetical protein EAE96_004761 [Botrytis aclada]